MLDALAALLKTLLYAGLLSCVGVVFAAATLRGAVDLQDVADRVMRRGAWLVIVCAVASAALLALRLGGDLDEATLSAVFLSSSGAALCLQIAGASLLLATIGDESARIMRLGNAAIATLSFAFNGHAAAVGFTVGLVAFVHASAAAWWIGSLWLLKSACTSVEPARTSALVQRFSAIAIGIVGALVLAGVVLILVLVDFDRLSELASYAKLLALKVALAAIVLGIAVQNKFRLTPRLTGGDAAAADELRRMIGWELAVIAVVLFATAILTTYESPHLSAEQ
jgi:putative copper export protein